MFFWNKCSTNQKNVAFIWELQGIFKSLSVYYTNQYYVSTSAKSEKIKLLAVLCDICKWFIVIIVRDFETNAFL